MIAVRAFTVRVFVVELDALEFVQALLEFLRYCHWYFRLEPVAVMETVVCVPSGAEKFAGCFVIVGFVTALLLTVRVTTLLVTLPAAFVILQRYW